MEFVLFSLLNGISYGLLLFLLSVGLTLIFGMMGVLNQISAKIGFWPALVLAPLMVGVVGALVERFGLRRVHKFGHVAELLFTFGLAFLLGEAVQLIWGRSAVDYQVPAALDGPLFTLFATAYPAYRGFMMLVSLSMLLAMYLGLTKTRVGLIIQAALTHPQMVEALGHNVPRIFMLVFGGGCALAGLAGVIGGNAFVTEPGMAAAVGSIIFVVVVVGGMGSLAGAFIASLIIGVMQTFSVGLDVQPLSFLGALSGGPVLSEIASLKISRIAPILPYLLLVLMLIVRPKGLMGTREG